MQRVVSKSILKSVLASLFAMAFVVSVASAKFPSFGDKADKSATVDIPANTQVPNGPTLAPGTYKVKVLSESGTPQVGFYKGGTLVGQAAASLVDQGRKSNETAAHFNNANGNKVLTQIDVTGWTKSIEFGPTAGASGSAQSGQ
jgi:hypothetical protein